MSDETESYYRVPVGIEKTLSGDKREMTVWSHFLVALSALAVAGIGLTAGPQFIGYIGVFITGWAGNNTLIAWRCDRVENSEVRD